MGTKKTKKVANGKMIKKIMIAKGWHTYIDGSIMVAEKIGGSYRKEFKSLLIEETAIAKQLIPQVKQYIEETDREILNIVLQNQMVFAMFTSALRDQAQMFVGLLPREAKQSLNQFMSMANKFNRDLRKQLNDDTMVAIEECGDAISDAMSVMKDAILKGQFDNLLQLIGTFDAEILQNAGNAEKKEDAKVS